MPKSVLIPAALVYAFGALGSVAVASTYLYLIEQYVCREHYNFYEPARIGGGGVVDETFCKLPEIQSEVARIYGVYQVLTFLPALVLTGSWGRLARILGKKTVLFLNGCSMVVAACYFSVICYYHQHFNIRMVWLTPLFDIIGGGQVILTSLIYTYIAETVDSTQLSGVFYKISAVELLMAFLGMTLGSVMLRINVWLLSLVGILILFLMIPGTLLLPSSQFIHTASLPSPRASSTPSIQSSDMTALLSGTSRLPPSTVRIIFDTLTSNYSHSLKLFTSIFQSSALNRLTLITFFLLTLTSAIRVIFSQWASLTYRWILADVQALASFEMMISAAILLSIPIISKTYITPRIGSSPAVDIWVMKASLGFSFLGLALMSSSPNRASYIASVTIFTLGSPMADSLRSFSTGLMADKEEVDNLYLGIGFVETLGGMVATAMWSGLFSNVVGKGWMVERMPFWGCLVSMACLWFVLQKLRPFASKAKEESSVARIVGDV